MISLSMCNYRKLCLPGLLTGAPPFHPFCLPLWALLLATQQGGVSRTVLCQYFGALLTQKRKEDLQVSVASRFMWIGTGAGALFTVVVGNAEGLVDLLPGATSFPEQLLVSMM